MELRPGRTSDIEIPSLQLARQHAFGHLRRGQRRARTGTEGVCFQQIIITTQKWTVTRPRPSHLASYRVRRAPRGLVFGRRGSVGGPTTAAGISSLADRSLVSIIARRRRSASAGVVATTFGISSQSFGKDGLRNSIGFGLKLKNTNSHRC